MAVSAEQIAVADEATLLSGTARRVVIHNRSADTSVFIGGVDVTTSEGFELKFGERLELSLPTGGLYGIVAADTEPVHVLRL